MSDEIKAAEKRGYARGYQAGYQAGRRAIGKPAPPLPSRPAVSRDYIDVSDDAVIAALSRHSGGQLYAPASQHNSRVADLSRWYATYGLLPGALRREQVERLARQGRIVPAYPELGEPPEAYKLPRGRA